MTNADPYQTQLGLVAPYILVDEAALESDEKYEVVQSVVDFVNWAGQMAMLNRDEIPREALLAYHVDYYLAQVNNGGHRQFAHNSRMSAATLDDIEAGLNAMGAREFLSIFKDFLALTQSRPDLLAVAMEDSAYKTKTPEFDALDNPFFALDGGKPLLDLNTNWLQSLPNFKALSVAELKDAQDEILSRNPLLAERRAHRIGLREAEEAKDPTYVAIKALCAKAGLLFEGLNAGSYPDEKGKTFWGVRTSSGVRFALLGPEESILFSDYSRKKMIVTLRAGETSAGDGQETKAGFWSRLFRK